MIGLLGRAAGRVTVAAASGAIAIGLTAAPQPAHALSPGEGVAIGLGALAVGTAIGSAPYYGYPGLLRLRARVLLPASAQLLLSAAAQLLEPVLRPLLSLLGPRIVMAGFDPAIYPPGQTRG
jgi:hypothetical protein